MVNRLELDLQFLKKDTDKVIVALYPILIKLRKAKVITFKSKFGVVV